MFRHFYVDGHGAVWVANSESATPSRDVTWRWLGARSVEQDEILAGFADIIGGLVPWAMDIFQPAHTLAIDEHVLDGWASHV